MTLATEQQALGADTFMVEACRDGAVLSGTYRVVRRIGSGGSGHVFEVEHTRLGKHFALKLLRNDATSRTATQRFRREARAVARLRSEHIVSIVDCGELGDSTPYLVMELLEGEDLRRLLEREGALPARRSARIALDACRGLCVVHAAGLVHRDLKPENLFVTRRSTGEDLCKVLDFGVVKMESSLSTTEGAIVGTVRYMAPEQLTNADTVGAPADIYAIGAILYECLLGRPLTSGRTVQELMYGVMNVTPKSLRAELPTLPVPLTDLVEGCINKDPKRRPASVAYVANALEQFLSRDTTTALHHQTTVEHTPALEENGDRSQKSAKRAPLVLALVVGGCLGWFTRGVPQAPEATALALRRAPLASLPVATSLIAPDTGAASVSPVLSSTSRNDPQGAPLPQGRKQRPAKPAAASAARSTVSNFDRSNPYQD